MTFCTLSDLQDYLLPAYLSACEQQNPELAGRTIMAVSGEIADLLAARYPQPWPAVPAIIRYIASVIAAYRVVEAITTLVSTESSADNEWIPLQNEWKRATDMLEDIALGKLKLPLEELVEDRDDPSVAVFAPQREFDFRGF